MSTMLLSIKPEYAKVILKGEKQYEFRKTRCRPDINRIIIYASSPQKQVVGEAEIDKILEDTPENIWKTAKNVAGVSKQFFDAYYAGKDLAIAYHLTNIKVYDTPQTLADYNIKNAPQSYRYLSNQCEHIVDR